LLTISIQYPINITLLLIIAQNKPLQSFANIFNINIDSKICKKFQSKYTTNYGFYQCFETLFDVKWMFL